MGGKELGRGRLVGDELGERGGWMREEGWPMMCVVFATLDVTVCAVTSDEVFKPPISLRPYLLYLSSTSANSFTAESHLLDRHLKTDTW